MINLEVLNKYRSQMILPSSVLDHLLVGIHRDTLELFLADHLHVPVSDPRVQIERMNLAGSLRSWGFIVTGGRVAPKDYYCIVDWVQKPDRLEIDQWPDDLQSQLNEIRALPTIESLSQLDQYRSRVRESYGQTPVHETSIGYLWSYELARDRAFVYTEGHEVSLVIQRFPNNPRFRVFNIGATQDFLYRLAQKLSPISSVPVQILGITEQIARGLKSLDPKGWFGGRTQAVYDTRRLAQIPTPGLNSRAQTTLRAHERTASYLPMSEDLRDNARQIIDDWKKHNEVKHRQLAITRDYVAARTLPLDTSYIGHWDGHWTCVHLLDRIDDTSVAQIVEKSLNYRELPGGRPGTADYNLIMSCRRLADRGITKIYAGGYDGGGFGLSAHKERFALPQDNVSSWGFYVSTPHRK